MKDLVIETRSLQSQSSYLNHNIILPVQYRVSFFYYGQAICYFPNMPLFLKGGPGIGSTLDFQSKIWYLCLYLISVYCSRLKWCGNKGFRAHMIPEYNSSPTLSNGYMLAIVNREIVVLRIEDLVVKTLDSGGLSSIPNSGRNFLCDSESLIFLSLRCTYKK